MMAYDYYGAWDNVTGINAPLYGKDLPGEGQEDELWKNVVCDGGLESMSENCVNL